MPRDWRGVEVKKCPHENIVFCPLYRASHIAGAGGCDDGQLAEGGCAVSRGMDYHAAVKRLEVEQFTMVAECEFEHRHHERNEQRKRNLRVNGVH